jgi:hypothetical protein
MYVNHVSFLTCAKANTRYFLSLVISDKYPNKEYTILLAGMDGVYLGWQLTHTQWILTKNTYNRYDETRILGTDIGNLKN